MNTPHNPIGWFEIYVQDMARAKPFYETVFQTKLEALPLPDPEIEMWAFPPIMASDQPGCSGALCKMKDKDPGNGGTLIYFICDDCAVEASRAATAGGKIHMEKMRIGQYGHIALIIDSEGNMVGLHSMK